MVILIEVGITLRTFSSILYPIFGFNLLYFFAILVGKPYQRKICNITLLIAEFAAIFSILLPILQEHTTISQSIEILVIFALLITLSLAVLFTLFRLGLLYHYIFSHFCQKNDIILCKKRETPRKKPRMEE